MKMKKPLSVVPLLLALAAFTLAQNGSYGWEHFDGAFTLSGWKVDSVSQLSFPADGVHNQAVRITDCASRSSSSHCLSSTSTYGEMASVSHNTNVHAGYPCPVGQSCTTSAGANGIQEETWYRAHIRLAPGYQATPGTQNAILEFHVDSKTEADAKATGGVTAYSTMIDIEAEGPSCSGKPAWCSTPGTNPRLFLQVPGGPTSCGNACLKRFFPFAANSLLIDHWYDMVLHIIWSETSGYVQWWVDGQKMVDVHTPTEYIRSDGTFSYANGWGLYNYRHWANWVSSVDGDEFMWGPSADSIGFTPAG
jgi:hypothetical protein